jgi:protein-S-isoprenylcysteine O-methyltransferase Ste14
MIETPPARSPWWYRQRALCIAALYVAGFYAASALALLAHRPDVSTYAFFGVSYQRPILVMAVLLAAIGWCLRAWGASYLRVEVVWNRDALTDKLYVAGPFRYTRNPLYLGNLFQAMAFAMFAPPAGWWLVPFVQWIFLTALMRVEERQMRARYGAAFDAYCASVPQLLPRLPPVAGEEAPHGSFAAALLSETMSLSFVLALLVFTIFGPQAWPATWTIAGIGAIFQYAVRWRDARATS